MFLDAAAFPALAPLGRAWREVAAEMAALRRGAFAPWPEEMLNRDGRWTVFGLIAFGRRLEGNRALCPLTAALVDAIPGIATAGFSRLAPGARLAPHVGYHEAGSVARCHLGLEVPDGCALRVAGETRVWREGAWLVFDDASEHEAWNAGEGTRTLLLLDLMRDPASRPRLTSEAGEFVALQAFLDGLSAPPARKGPT